MKKFLKFTAVMLVAVLIAAAAVALTIVTHALLVS